MSKIKNKNVFKNNPYELNLFSKITKKRLKLLKEVGVRRSLQKRIFIALYTFKILDLL